MTVKNTLKGVNQTLHFYQCVVDIYLSVHTDTHTHMHTYTRTHNYTHTPCTHTRTHTHGDIHNMHPHTHSHIKAHKPTHACTYTCAHITEAGTVHQCVAYWYFASAMSSSKTSCSVCIDKFAFFSVYNSSCMQ